MRPAKFTCVGSPQPSIPALRSIPTRSSCNYRAG
jgi:hypothetical protein